VVVTRVTRRSAIRDSITGGAALALGAGGARARWHWRWRVGVGSVGRWPRVAGDEERD